MFGAAEAARRWARKMQEKDRAEGRNEGRKAVIAALRARANGNAELHRLLDEVENEGQ